MIPVSKIADKLNKCAADLCKELLPNGREAGNYWQFSGIADTGKSWSAYVYLTGPQIGHWRDEGNCGPGEDRGDMLDLLRLKLGLADGASAVAEAKSRLGIIDTFEGKPRQLSQAERERYAAEAREREQRAQAELERRAAEKARRAKALYLAPKSVAIADTPVEAYLRGRMIGPGRGREWPQALRFNPEVYYKPTGEKLPAMLAPIYRADGEHIGTHRTYLNQVNGQWTKINSPDAKKVLGNKRGGFVPINKGSSGKSMRQMPDGEPVYVTEGIEDALCIRMIKPEYRICAAIDLTNLGLVVFPPAARQLVLVCDRDEKAKAQDALERAIGRQQERGLDLRLVMPPAPHKDINDWLRALHQGEAA
jgi:hypothetical protein